MSERGPETFWPVTRIELFVIADPGDRHIGDEYANEVLALIEKSIKEKFDDSLMAVALGEVDQNYGTVDMHVDQSGGYGGMGIEYSVYPPDDWDQQIRGPYRCQSCGVIPDEFGIEEHGREMGVGRPIYGHEREENGQPVKCGPVTRTDTP